jgi:hypothetical protein
MKYLLPLILLSGCASMPMPDKTCEAKADAIATATTKPQMTPWYWMEWLGKKQDAYKACLK